MSGYRVRREDDFDFRSAEYADLYSRAAATPFQHGLWLSTLYEVLAPRRGAEKLVITARDADGRLVLVLPLARRRRGPLRLIEFADLGVNDYAAPVLDSAAASALAGAEVSGQIRAALGAFDLLRIERVADSPGSVLALLPGAEAKRHSYDTHIIDLSATVEDRYERLDPQFVRHLERKYKRLRPKGERRLRLVTDAAEVEPLMERMRHFRAARFAERRAVDRVQEEDYFAFYVAAAQVSVADGPGRLVALEVAGEPVAVAFDLVDPRQELFLLVGYDVERLRNYSLGLLIVDELIRDAIQMGRTQFDLTVGDESYKPDFGAHPRPLFEVRLPRTPVGLAGQVARDGYLRSRQFAKKVLLAWENRQRHNQERRPQEQPGTEQNGGRGRQAG